MTTPSEITATEKLLDLIRSGAQPISQSPIQDHGDGQDDLSATGIAPATKEDTEFVLTLENSGTEGGATLAVEELSSSPPPPPLQAEQTSCSQQDDGASMREETSPPSSPPHLEQPAPSASATAQEDDDDDEILPLPEITAGNGFNIQPGEESPRPDSTPRGNLSSLFFASPSTSGRHSLLNFKRLRLPAKISIGIDIRPGLIHLVKTQTNKNGPELLACESVPYDCGPGVAPKVLTDDQEFKAILFRALSNFHTSHEHHEIWCSYPFTTPVELHNVSVPKVADADLANAVFWSAKRELEFDETATIFDYAPLQDITESNQAKTQTLVTLAPRPEVESVKAMFKNAGFPLTGLSFPAAAIQSFLRHEATIPSDKPIVHFTIRKSYSFIDLYYQGKMFFSREIKTGVDSFVESLLDHALSQSIILDENNAKEYLFRSANPQTGSPQGSEGLAPMFDWDSLSVIGRLARQLVRTFEYCATTFKVPAVGAIVTSGEFTVIDAILKSIENRVGVKCSIVDPLSSTIFHQDTEHSHSSISNLLVAAGLSLSDKQSTANFLFTYADRAKEASSNRVNSYIAIASICLALGLGAVFVWQYNKALGKEKEVALLQKKLEAAFHVEPRSRSNDYLSQTVQKIAQFHLENKEKAIRFQTVAMIGELTKTLNEAVTLTDLVLDLAPVAKETKTPPNASPEGSMTITGFISAPPENQEFILMNFVKDLSQLTILGDPALQSKANASLRNRDVLRFEVRLKTSLSFLTPPAS